ncbi:uncharacterized protein MELLADRAFT_59173 [Melampsora larici-populina 98AG31]|uniref:CxC5 like cysteine cluster associated with KDZ domain-containing protein n=1 Tax=Melampsora larici-populina (strain 98AG31 / pathotype 3-4-7) TaxID=747676 RepID=F4R5B0_MELLP|nr:uncharacterized protein MELLADRAFT_59173 [Melampsora larici-populina 98AG31]EGG12016.1 hypothetical protein MELLADRAFT_59173 [Melampsora larici-populina 98AG31]
MLLTDLVTRLHEISATLATKLTLSQLIQFVNLASDVYKRADRALNFTSDDTRILPFLKLALDLDMDLADYKALWNLSFPSLPFSWIDTGALIRSHGLTHHLTTKVHEFYLTPPISACLVCDSPSKRNLHLRPRREGYVYDLDGIHSAEFHTRVCSGTVFAFT